MHVSPARGRPRVPVGGAGFPFAPSYNILFLFYPRSNVAALNSAGIHRTFSPTGQPYAFWFCPCDPVTTEPELSQLAAGAEIWLAVQACRAPRLDPGAVTHPTVCNWGWCGGEGEPRVSGGKSSLLLSVWASEGWREERRGGGEERDGRR